MIEKVTFDRFGNLTGGSITKDAGDMQIAVDKDRPDEAFTKDTETDNGTLKPNDNKPTVTEDSNLLFDMTWINGRKNGRNLSGTIRCTYAKIFLPTTSGVAKRIFSLQRSTFPGAVITDEGAVELNQEQTARYFGVIAPCNSDDYLNLRTFHVGKLTPEVFEYVRAATGGRVINPYVLYDPRNFKWTESESKKGSVLPLLLAAAAVMLN